MRRGIIVMCLSVIIAICCTSNIFAQQQQYPDANKIGPDPDPTNPQIQNNIDGKMCWPAAAANALEYTGWCQPDAQTIYQQEFLTHWENNGGLMRYAWLWRLLGWNKLPCWLQPGTPSPNCQVCPGNWAKITDSNAPSIVQCNSLDENTFCDSYCYYGRFKDEKAMEVLDCLLKDGYGVAIMIYDSQLKCSRHALSVWPPLQFNTDGTVTLSVTDSQDMQLGSNQQLIGLSQLQAKYTDWSAVQLNKIEEPTKKEWGILGSTWRIEGAEILKPYGKSGKCTDCVSGNSPVVLGANPVIVEKKYVELDINGDEIGKDLKPGENCNGETISGGEKESESESKCYSECQELVVPSLPGEEITLSISISDKIEVGQLYFKLTDRAFQKLLEGKVVSSDMIEGLFPLRDKEFTDEDQFKESVKGVLKGDPGNEIMERISGAAMLRFLGWEVPGVGRVKERSIQFKVPASTGISNCLPEVNTNSCPPQPVIGMCSSC